MPIVPKKKAQANARANSRRLELDATIAELAPGGDGVAILEIEGERRATFVRGVAVGDRVRLRVDTARKPARGEVLELLAAGDARVSPACAFTARCGGCDWMHVSLDGQRLAHAEHVRRALPPSFRSCAITPHAAPAALAYRGRARLHVRGSGGRVTVGMHEVGSHDPVEVEQCVVLAPPLEALRRALPPLLEGAHGRGDAQIALGRFASDQTPGGDAGDTPTERKPVLELRWSGTLAAVCYGRLEQAVARGEISGARVMCGDALRPSIIGDPTPWMLAPDGLPLRLAQGGFGQASDAANALLGERIAALCAAAIPPAQDPAKTGTSRRIVELYAGAGNLTVLLAALFADVTAVETQREACEAARANLAARSRVDGSCPG